MGCCVCVEESQVAIVETMGKFSRVVYPGCNALNCWCERVSGTISLRIQQYELDIETRTKDNVFVTIKLAMRVKVAENENEFLSPRPVRRRRRHDEDESLVASDETDHLEGQYSQLSQADEDEHKETLPKKDLLYMAHYKLRNPIGQLTAHIENYFRFHAMRYSLDEMYSAKD